MNRGLQKVFFPPSLKSRTNSAPDVKTKMQYARNTVSGQYHICRRVVDGSFNHISSFFFFYGDSLGSKIARPADMLEHLNLRLLVATTRTSIGTTNKEGGG